MNNILAGFIVGCLASVGVLGSGRVLYGWDVGNVASYKLSHGLGNLFGFWSLLIGAGILLFLIRFSYVSYLISACIVPVPMLLAILYECRKNPTSHNLAPVEVIGLVVGSILIHLPSCVIKVLYSSVFL